MHRSFKKLTNVLVVTALVALTGCNSHPDRDADTLSIAFNGAPLNAGPGFSSSQYSSALVLASYQTLFEYRYLKRPLELVPSLAADWPVVTDGGKTLDITLVEDARFSDDPVFDQGIGRTVTATDVAYSLLRHFDTSTKARGRSEWRDLIVGITEWSGDYQQPPSGIEVIDDRTIRFRLTSPSPIFLHKLATHNSVIVPREAEEAYGEKLGHHSVGSGPYQLESLGSQRAVLTRNPNYQPRRFNLDEVGFDEARDGADYRQLEGQFLPITDRIVVHFIEQMMARWITFDNGDLDVIPVTDRFLADRASPKNPSERSAELANRSRLVLGDRTQVSLIRVRMDDADLGFVSDPVKNQRNTRLRCAIRDALDPTDRNRLFFEGRALALNGVIAATLPEFTANDYVISGPPSPAATDVFLALAEEADLPEIRVGYKQSPINADGFTWLENRLIAAGYPRELIEAKTYATFGEYINSTHDGKHQISTVGWTLAYPDVENNLQLFYGPNRSPGVNLGNYQNERYDALFERIRSMSPSQERSRLVKEMNALLWEDCAFFSSLSPLVPMLVQRQVIGKPDRSAVMDGRYFKYLGKNQ
ncbi:MAG: ABC transporter substrate-binding protein [Lysobacterales bacterium]